MTGEQLKSSAHTLLKRKRSCIIRDAQIALIRHLLAHETGTADDIRDVVKLPDEINPVCLGAAPGDLVRDGIIEPLGYQRSKRPEAHARPLQVWRLSSTDKAQQWLDDHPPLPTEDDSYDLKQGLLFDTSKDAARN